MKFIFFPDNFRTFPRNIAARANDKEADEEEEEEVEDDDDGDACYHGG